MANADVPQLDELRAQVLEGLRQERKWLPCRLLYDERGSELFERITALEEYYPTRTEHAIMTVAAPAMGRIIDSGCVLIEYGSGSSTKTCALLDHLPAPAAYLPIDVSRAQLEAAAATVRARYPTLEVAPLCADYNRPVSLPPAAARGPRVAYFPGSTVGNFNPPEAVRFLTGIARTVGPGGCLVIGVDLPKDRALLEAAYDDRQGVTAAFNLNVLRHLNRILEGDFDLESFAHRSCYDSARGRIEMHLVSGREQVVTVAGERFRFGVGETILTEVSYKFTLDGFALLAGISGFDVAAVWTDRRRMFSVQLLRARPGSANGVAPVDVHGPLRRGRLRTSPAPG
ncbi:MAG: L-histidine N(alpha)-methyltransferase [Spirochaetaceae bacterium]|nr:L-histidine N(alpha)-methyltransferase [Spirochaetaceae bacterium]